MITLHLTAQSNIKGQPKRRIFIAAESVTVFDLEGRWDFNSIHLGRGCNVDDGKHNNGGWKVEESYDEVVSMISEQVSGGAK